jgi:hypothetical protein
MSPDAILLTYLIFKFSLNIPILCGCHMVLLSAPTYVECQVIMMDDSTAVRDTNIRKVSVY